MDVDEIKQYTQGVKFPIKKDDLVSTMRERGANDQVCGMVEKLPMDEIRSPGDIASAVNPFD